MACRFAQRRCAVVAVCACARYSSSRVGIGGAKESGKAGMAATACGYHGRDMGSGFGYHSRVLPTMAVLTSPRNAGHDAGMIHHPDCKAAKSGGAMASLACGAGRDMR